MNMELPRIKKVVPWWNKPLSIKLSISDMFTMDDVYDCRDSRDSRDNPQPHISKLPYPTVAPSRKIILMPYKKISRNKVQPTYMEPLVIVRSFDIVPS